MLSSHMASKKRPMPKHSTWAKKAIKTEIMDGDY